MRREFVAIFEVLQIRIERRQKLRALRVMAFAKNVVILRPILSGALRVAIL